MAGDAFWNKYTPRHFVGFGLLLLLTAVGVGAFVWWQLARRRWAADMVSACVNVLATWNPDTLRDEDVKAKESRPPAGSATFGGVKFPGVLVQAFDQNVANHKGPWLPREVPLGLMILWTLAGLGRVWSEWGGTMLGVNWWSAVGLIFDVFGALGLAFSLQWFSRGTTGTQAWEFPKNARWAFGVSGVILVVGFLLQLLGQFPSAMKVGAQ
jgi:hypothetical protein